jgi:LysR family transcriptional regulator, glycine cleavage system transcriptional activator
MRKIPPMNAVRAFEAAARHISFTKAAGELSVTHGAVSKQVAILEAWLNTPLFNRSPSQLSLTDAGRTLLAATTPALDRIAATATQLLEQASPSALRINAPPTFTMRWLIPRISSYQRKRSDVEIKFTTSIAPVNFAERSYDIAIRAGDQPLAGLRSIPFMTETIVPICHPDLMERGRLQSPADLAKHTLINYDTEPLTWPDWLAAASVPSLHPENQLRFEQMYFALQAAAEGLGVVLVPLFLVADDIIAGKLCAPFGMLAARQRRYYANSPLSLPNSPVIDSFNEWLMTAGQETEKSIGDLAASMAWTA